MKKILLSLGIILGLFSLVDISEAYTDTTGSQYASAINSLTQQGIVEGYDDGTFRPDNSINRAEFVKIIMGSMQNLPPDDLTDCQSNNTAPSWSTVFFPDVVKGQWYANYVCSSKIRDVIDGYPDGTFKPANNVNYAEALKIVYGSRGDQGDETQIATWYSPYLEDAKANNIDLGIDPSKEITRGEMAQLIVNYDTKKPYIDPTANLTSEDFFTYTNNELGISIELPKALEDYQDVVTMNEWPECGGVNYANIEFIPKKEYNAGVHSYGDYASKGSIVNASFEINAMLTSDVCDDAYLMFADYSLCDISGYDTECEIYRNKRHLQRGTYTYEFIPYGEKAHNSTDYIFLYNPKEGELQYMRDSFKVID